MAINLSEKQDLTAYDTWIVISQLSSLLTFILIVPQIAIPAIFRHGNTYFCNNGRIQNKFPGGNSG